MKLARRRFGLAGACLFVAAAAWAINQQAAYVLASTHCMGAGFPISIVSILALILLVAGAYHAIRIIVRSDAAESEGAQNDMRVRRFIAIVGLCAALLFLFAIGLQAVALVFLPACAA